MSPENIRNNEVIDMPLFAFRLIQKKTSRPRRVYNAVKERPENVIKKRRKHES